MAPNVGHIRHSVLGQYSPFPMLLPTSLFDEALRMDPAQFDDDLYLSAFCEPWPTPPKASPPRPPRPKGINPLCPQRAPSGRSDRIKAACGLPPLKEEEETSASFCTPPNTTHLEMLAPTIYGQTPARRCPEYRQRDLHRSDSGVSGVGSSARASAVSSLDLVIILGPRPDSPTLGHTQPCQAFDLPTVGVGPQGPNPNAASPQQITARAGPIGPVRAPTIGYDRQSWCRSDAWMSNRRAFLEVQISRGQTFVNARSAWRAETNSRPR